MHQVNPLLAKLLAKENLSVEHGNYKTAWFDVKNRVLGLPIWKDHGKDVYDLLVGHEVGHALYTPYEGIHSSNEEIKGCPRDYINVVEDARIERKIRETYPGLIRTFKTGYKKLFDSGLFGDDIADRVNTLKLIDKINLKAKLSDLIDIDFNDEEMQLYYETMNTQTFSDVCAVVKKILAYTQEQNEKEGEDQYSPNEDDQPMESSDEDNNNDDSQPDQGEESDDEEGEYSEEASDNDEELVEEEDEESKTKIVSLEPEHNDEEFSETDQIFRSNEEKLLDVNENGSQTLFINDYNQKQRDEMVVPYAKLAESRAETIGQPSNNWKELEARYEVRMHCNKYIKEVKKAVQPAVKEFEMKKAAFQWQRASEAKTGSINVDKLHSYKYNEDIFARVTNMADAKNHGLMLLVDYSGSMYDVIGNVIQQTMHMVTFCKAVNIPFKVYAFTTTSEYISIQNGAMDADELAMVELISSDLKKKDYEEAMYNLALRAFSKGLIDYGNDHHREYIFNYKLYTSKYEEFGSTPLNQALMVSNDLIKKFIKKNAIQKFNFVTITDGDANRVQTWRSQDNPNDMPIAPTYSNGGEVIVKVGNKAIKTNAGRRLTESLMNNIRETYNANTMGFFIADRSAEFNYRCVGAAINKNQNDDWVDHTEIKRAAAKEYRKNKCVEFKDVFGYNSYFMLKGGKKDLDTTNEEFNPTTNKSIGNDFKKFSKSKKTNKVLMQKIGAAVA
jgi:ACT domain-containing protein